MFIEFVGLTLLLALAPSTEAFADSTSRTLPISAHNCYAENRTDNPRLTEALALGIDNIEIDLGWDEAAKELIVGHDATPRPGVEYPRLETSLFPALESHLKNASTRRRADRAHDRLEDGPTRGGPAVQGAARRARRMVLVGPQGGRLPINDPAADRLLQRQRGCERCL